MSPFYIFPIPVRVRVKQVRPRIRRHRLRRMFRFLVVLFVVGLIAQNWKFFLGASGIIVSVWLVVWVFSALAYRRDPLGGSPEFETSDFDEHRSRRPPLASQFSTGMRGLGGAFREGFRKGRREG